MASERQRLANRHNGSKGGPSTEAGKQRSRLNTIKHGLTSTTLVVLPEEHQHEYEEVLRGFRESFQPQGAAEEALVLRLAQAHWRTLRSRRVETGILDITASTERALARNIVEDCPDHLSPHNAIAVGFMKNPEERWGAYLRYDGAISRDFFRTLDALTRLQRERQPKSPDAKPLVATAGSAPPLSDSGIRSVSQNSPIHDNQHKAPRAAHVQSSAATDARPSGSGLHQPRISLLVPAMPGKECLTAFLKLHDQFFPPPPPLATETKSAFDRCASPSLRSIGEDNNAFWL